MSNEAGNAVQQKRKPIVLRLRTVIALFMSLAALGPLAFYGVATFNETTNQVSNRVRGELIKSNQANSKLVTTWLNDHETIVKTMAVSPELTGMQANRAVPYLTSINEQSKEFYSIFLIDKSGKMIARSTPDKLQDVSDREYFKKPLAGAPSYIQAVISKTIGKAILSFGVPIRNETGDIVGVLAAPAVIEQFSDQITGGKIGNTGFSYLVNRKDKTILAHPNVKLVGTQIQGTDLQKISKDLFGKINDGVSLAQAPIMFTSSGVGEEMVLVSEINQSEILDPISAVRFRALTFILAAALLSLAIAFYLARSISKKIERLSTLINGLSRAKNLNEIAGIEKHFEKVGGALEIRAITSAVLRLTVSLKVAMRSFKK